MKKYNIKLKTTLILISFLAVLLTVGISQAALLGLDLLLPDIASNQTGTYSYDATTDLLSFDATPMTISFDGTTLINIDNPTTANSGLKDYSADFYVDSSGNFTVGVSGNDIEIYGKFTYNYNTYDGLLVAGDVTNFGFQDLGWGNYAIFDYTFDVNNNSILNNFFGPKGGDVAFVEQDNNWDGTWDGGHSGLKVKHDTAPIPIPSTVWIFGAGVILLLGIRRKVRS